jgi:uncharacterized membrane protein YhaH (DUF805 family)
MSNTTTESVFSTTGRCGRKRYFLVHFHIFAVIFAFLFFIAVLDLLLAYFAADQGSLVSDELSVVFSTVYLIGAIIPLLIPTILVLFSAQRCRDFDWSGWAALFMFVPYIGLVFWIVLFFIPGTKET